MRLRQRQINTPADQTQDDAERRKRHREKHKQPKDIGKRQINTVYKHIMEILRPDHYGAETLRGIVTAVLTDEDLVEKVEEFRYFDVAIDTILNEYDYFDSIRDARKAEILSTKQSIAAAGLGPDSIVARHASAKGPTRKYVASSTNLVLRTPQWQKIIQLCSWKFQLKNV